ncbi:MAG: glutamate-5-semialdehyde dehydrogenase [Candidatus Hadarchaeales archaeon]
MEVIEKAKKAREASLRLPNLSKDDRNRILLAIAKEIETQKARVLEENAKDIREAETMLERGEITKPVLQRLKLNEEKIADITKMIRSVAELPDPLGKTVYAMEMDDNLYVYKLTCPIGVICCIFEARPDVLPQISSLCLKSGDAVILKGGREAKYSNRVFFSIFKEKSEELGAPSGWIQLVEERWEVRELLKLDEYIDLIIPRGGKDFVKYIQENTKIPVLGHAEGICHVYVDEYADLEKALKICFDAKVQYPAVCNAAETLLVHSKIAKEFLPKLAELYKQAGVEIRGCPRVKEILPDVKLATEEDWRTEYLDLIISIKIVDSIEEAINHINIYGSKHTDAIVTENMKNALKFVSEVDSSSVMVNASTRFSDGYRYGLGAEVGISTSKIHARGPVGLEGLTTTKYVVIGNGHVVKDYIGAGARPFKHKPIKLDWKEVLKI